MSARVLSSFAKRFAEVCDDLGLGDKRGRTSAVARMFGVSPNAAKKWLTGEGMPELAKAVEIANRAGVSVIWLLQGSGPKAPAPLTTLAGAVGHAVAALPASDGVEIADFVRYKIERATRLVPAMEDKARYLVELDHAVQDRTATQE